jgi:hypothetical protein
MESQSPNPIASTIDDAESKMRRNLGIDGASPSSSSNDPMKVARQAIRSQVTAREFTERQLSQAQGTIQDLRTKLRQVHHERETAVAAAQSAMAAKDTAERSVRAAEAALATERATRIRMEAMLRDAEVTVRDLREKLATANQNFRDVQAESDAERNAHQVADDAAQPVVAVPQTVAVPTRDAAAPTARRPVGRPRKIVTAEAILTPIRQSNGSQSSSENEAPSNRDAVAPPLRRPVGRPRKTAVAQPVERLIGPPRKAQAPAKPITKKASNRDDDQVPIQWWIDGWKEQ